MKPMISPSLMCMDLLNVQKSIACLDRRTDMYHIDIMDGHYCKNITLSPSFANAVASIAEKPIDVHLMVEKPGEILPLLKLRPGDCISVHAETINVDAFRVLNTIHEMGQKAGVVLNPATSLTEIDQYADRVDMLTIMTVDVGFAGQKFIREMLEKIRRAVQLRAARDYHYTIQIDGSCNAGTYRELYEAGAEIFVVGNSGLFSLDEDLDRAYTKLLECFREKTGVTL